MIQCSRSRLSDLNYSIYLWTQFPNELIRSKLLSNTNGEDSDDELVVPGQLEDEEVDEEMVAYTGGRIQYEKVHMVLAQNSFIYYVMKHNGLCSLYEGNPREPYNTRH